MDFCGCNTQLSECLYDFFDQSLNSGFRLVHDNYIVIMTTLLSIWELANSICQRLLSHS